MQVTTIGVDLAKNVFQVHGITATEEAVTQPPDPGRSGVESVPVSFC